MIAAKIFVEIVLRIGYTTGRKLQRRRHAHGCNGFRHFRQGRHGKTTLCAGIAACLAAEGKRVLCIDADIGLRNLDIALGMAEQPAVAFTDVTQGFCKLSDAAEHPALPGLFLLTAPVREQDALVEQQRFGALLREAREAFDWVLIDAAAGIGTSFRLATQFADRCIVAATPDPASLRDAACAADALALEGHELLQLVVNRVQPRLFSRMNLTVDDMMDQTGLPLLGLLPEDRPSCFLPQRARR